MASFDDVVIISGCRTPVGKFQGSLSEFSAPQLGAIVVREAVKRAGLAPAEIDECIMGNVISADRWHDNQQSLWLRAQSRPPRGASGADRKQFHRGRRWNGIDDQRSLS